MRNDKPFFQVLGADQPSATIRAGFPVFAIHDLFTRNSHGFDKQTGEPLLTRVNPRDPCRFVADFLFGIVTQAATLNDLMLIGPPKSFAPDLTIT